MSDEETRTVRTVFYCQRQIDRLTAAVMESHRLLQHYAGLLNQYDGGQRIIPDSVDDWVERLNTPEEQRRPLKDSPAP